MSKYINVFKGSPKVVVPEKDSLAFDFLHRNDTLCWISHGRTKLESFIPVNSESAFGVHNSRRNTKNKSELKCTSISSSQHSNIIPSFQSWNLPQPDMFDLNTVNHIAVDWISKNWYFLDDTRELVLLCGLKIPCKLADWVHKKRCYFYITPDPHRNHLYDH